MILNAFCHLYAFIFPLYIANLHMAGKFWWAHSVEATEIFTPSFPILLSASKDCRIGVDSEPRMKVS